jgi:hypothetical protein
VSGSVILVLFMWLMDAGEKPLEPRRLGAPRVRGIPWQKTRKAVAATDTLAPRVVSFCSPSCALLIGGHNNIHHCCVATKISWHSCMSQRDVACRNLLTV